ncbi:MAG: hypothetical protein IBX55_18665 [Methyloprofundus sp.]|nr:hypothetical protein [Methyloprofundus sp.]
MSQTMHQLSSQAVELFKAMTESKLEKAINKDEAAARILERVEFGRYMWNQTATEKGLRDVILIAGRLKQSVNVNDSYDLLTEKQQLAISDGFKRMFNFVNKFQPLANAVA